MKIELYYDKECPFCNSYAKYLKVKEKHKLALFNARDYLNKMKTLEEKGFNINEGFVIIVDEKNILQGSEAIVFLNKISKNKIFFPNIKFFKIYVYSFVKIIRKIVLKLLRKRVDII